MGNYFEQNKRLLEKHCLNLEFENVEVDSSFLDENLGLIRDEKNPRQFQSRMDKELPVTVWCDQFSDITNQAVIFVFGMGDYRYIEQLANTHTKDMIVVYEPDEKILLHQMYHRDLSELLKKDNVVWVVGKNRRGDLCAIVDERLDYQNGFECRMAAIPNYIKNYAEDYNFFYKQIGMSKVYDMASVNTLIITEERRGKCFLHNFADTICQSGIGELIDAFKDIDVSGVPAIIIAAGPSLDFNIDELKGYEEQVFMICVDTAIPTAVAHNIEPDLLVSVDPNKPESYFMNEYGKTLPLIGHIYTNPEIIDLNCGRKFYSTDQGEYEKAIYGKYKKDLGAIVTGGTVANTAFSVARNLGFSTIILIGQDLAYPNKRMHAIDADREFDFEEGIKNGKYFYVDGVNGDKVLTEGNMCIYRYWYEEQIEKYPEISIIDATEGGALIKGAINMTLKEALREYCRGKKIDYSTIISSAEYILTPEERDDAQKRYLDTFDEIGTVQDNLREQLRLYNQLDDLNRKGKYNTIKFKKCIEEISIINEKMDNSLAIYLMRIFANQGEYELRKAFDKKQENKYGEILQMIRAGRKLDQVYLEAAEKLIKAKEETDMMVFNNGE